MVRKAYKKILGIALSAALAVTSMPVTALANEAEAPDTDAPVLVQEDESGSSETGAKEDTEKDADETGGTFEDAGSGEQAQDAGDDQKEDQSSGPDGSEGGDCADPSDSKESSDDAESSEVGGLSEEDELSAEDEVLDETGVLEEKEEGQVKEETEVTYNTDISFPEGFEGFVDDEAFVTYDDEEGLLKAPVSGAVNLDISGTFYTLSADKILDQINKIRKEACSEGVYFDGKNLTMDDYHPLKWSAALEHGTRIRAIEAAMVIDHKTLGGGDIRDHAKALMPEGYFFGIGENLAWNNNHDSSGITFGINQFYSEKKEYLKTKTWSGSTGHYCNLINPDYRFVGVGCCMVSGAPYGWNTVAMQLATDPYEAGDLVDTTKDDRTGKLSYSIPVKPAYVKSLSISGDATVPKGAVREYGASAGIKVSNSYGSVSGTHKVSESSRDAVSWSSSDESIFTVTDGNVTGVKGGKATLNAGVGSVSATKDITVTVSLDDIVITKKDDTAELKDLDVDRNETATANIGVTFLPEDTTDAKKVTYKSSNTGIVTVDSAGKLTFKKPGTATITATAKSSNKDVGEGGTITKSLTVNVTAPVTGIKLSKSALTLKYTGKTAPTATLGVSFIPSDTDAEKTVTFTSADESVATVDDNGKVTAVAGGETVITASAYGYTAECKVNVVVPLKTMTVDSETAKLYLPDKQGEIVVSLEPVNTSDKEVTFTSSDPDKVEVVGAEDGKTLTVTAVDGVARATITGASSDSAEATIQITAAKGKFKKNVEVVIAKPTTGISLSLDGRTLSSSDVIDLGVGGSVTPEAVVTPDDAYDTTVVWESSDEGVATVSRDGVVVATGDGEAVISATSYNAKDPVSASFKVKSRMSISSVSLSAGELELYVGDSATLSATVSPEGVTDASGAALPITYSSTNTAVATVSSDGRITAVSEGEAFIGAEVRENAASSNTVAAFCRVRVIRNEAAGDTPYGDDTTDSIWLASGSFDDVMSYTGKAIKQENARIYHGKTLLKEGRDYSLVYKNNVKPGRSTDDNPPQMTVKMKGNYTGSKTYPFTIEEADLSKNLSRASVSVTPGTVPYTDDVPDITVKVKIDGKEVDAGNYEIVRLSAGVGELLLSIVPSAAGSSQGYYSSKDFKVKVKADRSMNDVSMSGVEDVIFTQTAAAAEGGIQLSSLTLTYKGTEALSMGTDYRLTYSGNTKAGTATVTATGIGRYSGSARKTFKIFTNDGTVSGYELEPVYESEVAYVKGGVTPDISLKDADGVFLSPKSDFSVSVLKKSNQAPGTMTCVLTGKGNYKGYKSEEISITVTNGNLSKALLTVQDKAYTTKKNGWKSGVKLADSNGKALQAGKDSDKNFIYSYKGASESEVPAAGTIVYVTVVGKGYYEGSAITGSYRIYEKSISKAVVVVDDKVYTGSRIIPGTANIHVYANSADAKNKENELTPADDYYTIVSYGSNIKSGSGTVTIRGRGIFGGTKVCKFKILKKSFEN
jgi:uncharacterized protein YjdB/uncharacterized protein YkwD